MAPPRMKAVAVAPRVVRLQASTKKIYDELRKVKEELDKGK